jgi:hypothetical protein
MCTLETGFSLHLVTPHDVTFEGLLRLKCVSGYLGLHSRHSLAPDSAYWEET